MGDDIPRRDVDGRTVTNVFNGEVNHGLVIQTGSFEGDVHVHTPPGQSAGQDSAVAELKQRLEEQERAEREAACRRDRERRRRRRDQELASALRAREERVRPIRVLAPPVFCVLAFVLLLVTDFSPVSYLGLFLCFTGAAVARYASTSTLEGFLGKK
ncbi:hypothetical protein [Streptomyces sp. NPDC018045]|uniref:hypothetical protein n=1 Tax=Streptomyces sp. NPDC018045 TaxID=3365037 RepID=UPI003798B84B